MALSTFTSLCNYCYHSSLELVISETGTWYPVNTLTPHPSLPQPLATTIVLSVSMDLTPLGTAYK